MLCYVAFPASVQVMQILGKDIYRNWIDLAWAALSAILLLVRPVSSSPSRVWGMSRATAIAVCCVAFGLTLWAVNIGSTTTVTAAMELKPIAYVLIALLWIGRAALPEPRDFARYGAMLAVLLIFEALARSVATGTVVRPVGSGEVNYDAALLCVSLAFVTADRHLSRQFAWIIWAGIIASFSRTGLLAACLVLFLTSTISVRGRLAMSALAVGAALVSFAVRDLEVGNLEGFDRYWMWVAGLEYLVASPLATAFNTAAGGAIAVDVPIFIADLWTDQQDFLDLDGVYPFHFHAMWLRLSLAWGWVPVAIAAVSFFRTYFMDRRRSHEARPFFAVCVVFGLTMGLIYLGNVALVVLLAGQRIMQRRFPQTLRSTRATPARPIDDAAVAMRSASRETGGSLHR